MRFAVGALPHTFPSQRSNPAELDEMLQWQDPERHGALRDHLTATFDGFALAVHPEPRDTDVWAEWVEAGRIVAWRHLRLARDLGPVRAVELVVVVSPRYPDFDPPVHFQTDDVALPGATRKPDAWYRWVLAHLGVRPGIDDVVDPFTQSPLPLYDSMLSLETTP